MPERVLERRPWIGMAGDFTLLSCGHGVWVPSDWPQAVEADCGECAAEARGERSAGRLFEPAGEETR